MADPIRVANRYLARAVRKRTGVALTDLGPMRAARRSALLELGLRDRRFGWPLEMVLARRSRAVAHPRAGSRVSTSRWALEGHRHRDRHPSDRVRHAGGASVSGRERSDGRCHGEVASAGLREDPSVPTVYHRRGGPDRGSGAGRHPPYRRRSPYRGLLALDGPPGRWLPAGFPVVAQVAGALGDRLAGALANIDGPALAIGMDTPQLTTNVLASSCRRLLDPDVDAVLGPAADGGYWAIGFRTPCGDAFDGVPMSTTTTGARQWAQLDPSISGSRNSLACVTSIRSPTPSPSQG